MELLPRLRGDFSLLIWDSARGQGLLARDQLGVGPWYLYEAGGAQYFATEIRYLLAMLSRRPAPDPTGVAHWLAGAGQPGPGTLYEGVRRLDPGAALVLGRDGARERRFWDPVFAEPIAREETDPAALVRNAIDRAVRRRLAPHGQTGVLMSGGLDSASVAAFAAARAPGQIAAFSGVFPEHPAVDESDGIAQLRDALALGGCNAEVRSGGLLASALDSLRTWQLPLRSWGEFWMGPLVGAAASRGVGTMLGGDGGDELFATRVYLLADRLRAGAPRDALALGRELPGAGDAPPRAALARFAAALALEGAIPGRPHDAVRRPLSWRRQPSWLLARTRAALRYSDDPLAWKRLDGPRWWAHAAHGLSRGIEASGIFELHRHRAAGAGLQARHPLLDLDLVELVLRQDPRASFDRHRNRPVLRACVAGLVPDEVRLSRRKALFESLVADTLADADAPAIRRLLSGPGAELGAYVDLDRVRRELLEPGPGGLRTVDWAVQVWHLATAECWLRSQADPGCERLAELLAPSAARVVIRRASARSRATLPVAAGAPPRAPVPAGA